jgi:hypothetical protein
MHRGELMRDRLTCARVFIAIAIAFFATALLAQDTQSTWKQYSYPSDGFAFSAPSQPTFSQRTKPSDSGDLQIHTYSVVLGDSGMVMISSTLIPGLENASPKERLQSAKTGALAAGKAKLTSEHEITLGGYPGLQYEAQTDQLHVRARMYIVKNKLFQLMEIAGLTMPFPPDAERISSSFKFVSAQ